MNTKSEKTNFKTALVLLMSFVITIVSSELVLAQGILGRVGGSIGGLFNRYAANPAPTLFDLVVFFTIFFALCWIGFNQAFKDAKNANVALSAAFGIALSVALVYGGKFTLKKLLPFAATILVLLIIIGIYVLLKKVVFTKNTTFSKIIAIVIAIIVSAALLFIAWNLICSNGNCEVNPLMKKIMGTESVTGKFLGNIKNMFSGSGWDTTSHSPSLTHSETITSVAPTTNTTDTNGTTNWLLIVLTLGGITLIGLAYGTWQSKHIDKWSEKKQMKKRITTLSSTLKSIETNETSIIQNFRDLCAAVKNEQTIFDQSRHIVDKITTDIKETIGGEIDFIKGQKNEIDSQIDQLKTFNMTEKHLIIDPSNGILNHISDQMAKIGTIPKQIQIEIDELQNIAQHFDKHDNILDTFKQHNFNERGVITNIIARLKKNQQDFTILGQRCNSMTNLFTVMQDEVDTLVKKRKLDNYPLILQHVKSIREQAIRLNKIFAWKVSMIHYLGERLNELQDELGKLHETERATMIQYIKESTNMHNEGKFDIAIYLALHVFENAKYLETRHLNNEAIKTIHIQQEAAKKIIQESIPKLFDSLKDKIQGELDSNNYKRLIKLADTIGRIEAIEKEFDNEFRTLINNTYSNKMNNLKLICKTIMKKNMYLNNLAAELGVRI